MTLGDVATELSDSLSRSGKGGMTAPLRTADGAVGAPAQSFTSETGSGWFRHAAGELRLAILGVYRIAVTATVATFNAAVSVLGTLTVQSTTSLGDSATFTGGSSLLTTQANSSLTFKGNRDAADAGTDLVLNSTATRSAGALAEIQNNATAKARWDFNGEPSIQGGFPCGVAVKTDADQTEIAGVATNVTSMAFPVVANATYWWEAVFPNAAGTANGCQITWTGPAAATAVSFDLATSGNGFHSGITLGTFIGTTSVTLTSKTMCTSRGILVNGANAGTLQMQFKMAGGGATSATVYQGAFLRWRRVA